MINETMEKGLTARGGDGCQEGDKGKTRVAELRGRAEHWNLSDDPCYEELPQALIMAK